MTEDVVGDAWRRWTERLAALGERLGSSADFPSDPLDRAEGIRHLARQANLALRDELEHADPRHPTLHRYELPWSQWGAPNPDNLYLRCAIDPTATYVLRGQVGGVHEALFSLIEGDMHLDEHGVFAEVALTDLEVGDDGTVELWLGPDGEGPNRLVADGPARLLLVRSYCWDWANDPMPTFTIERSDALGEPAPRPTEADVAAALDRAGRWVECSVEHWAEYVAASRDLLEHNTFTPPNTPPGGAPSIGYGGGCWDLGDDEALLVELEEPDAHYWNWSIHQLHWFDSGPWHDRMMSLNGHQAHVDGDGTVRVVLAPADPGVPNWLDTLGKPVGMAVYRYVGARTKPVPTAKVVPIAELRSHLPDEHPTVDEQARRQALAERLRGAQRRWS